MEIVQREHPDLVSLDIKMPEMSGVKFYRKMREDAELSRIPIVIVTGLEEGDYIEVISGVEPGERVVTAGHGGLREGTRIKVLEPAPDDPATA